MYISEIFHVSKGHEHLDFVDVNCDHDVKAFIDPTLIEHDPSPIGKECNALINSYFNEVFDSIRRKDYDRLWQLSEHAHEPNETCLGLSRNRPSGKGASSEILMKIYQFIMDECLLEQNLISKPADIAILTENFAADRMSDLITNIIRRGLYSFTVEQCRKYKYALSPVEFSLGYFWSPEVGEWGEAIGDAFIVNGHNKLLVPKQFVCKTPIKSSEEFFRKIIIPHLQEEHTQADSPLARHTFDKKGNLQIKPPYAKDVRKDELNHGTVKDRVRTFMSRDFSVANEYESLICSKFKLGKGIMTDDELDHLVYDNT